MTIAITGATANWPHRRQAEEESPRLDIAAGSQPGKAAGPGVSAREADYEQPGTLDKALAGVDIAADLASEIGKRAIQHRNVIGQRRRPASNASSIPAAACRYLLANSRGTSPDGSRAAGFGIPTILRNGWYTENYTNSIGSALAAGTFIGSAGEGKIASAPRSDYAEAAVAVLTGNGHDGKVYELAGDQAWTLSDLAAEVSKQTGKNIPYKNLSEADYAAALKGFGLPEALAAAIAGWDVEASKGALFDDSRQLSKLIGHPTTPLADTVALALKS